MLRVVIFFSFMGFLALSSMGCWGNREVRQEGASQVLSMEERRWRQRALEALGRGDEREEKRIWSNYLAHHRKGKLLAWAHFRLASIARHHGRWRRAFEHLERARHLASSYPFKLRLLLDLTEVLFQLKRYDAIVRLWQGRWRHFPPKEHPKLLSILLKASEKLGDKIGSLRWRIFQIDYLKLERVRRERKERIVSEIKELSDENLRRLASFFSKRSWRRFPMAEIIAYRVQRAYDAGRFKLAKRLAKRWLSLLSESHPLWGRILALSREFAGMRWEARSGVLGVIYPKTGAARLIGERMRRGITLALREYPSVQVIFRDSASSSWKAVRAVEELVKRHKVIAIFGPPMKKTALAAAKKAQKMGVPFISISTAESLTSIGPMIFRNNFTLSAMARSVARYAFQALRIKRLGLLYPRSRYGLIQAKAFLKEARQVGASVVSAMHYDVMATDFQFAIKMLIGIEYENSEALLLKKRMLKGLKPYQKIRLRKKIAKMLRPLVPFEALFIPDSAKKISQIAPQLAYYNVDLKPVSFVPQSMFYSPLTRFRRIQLLGNNGWYDKELFRAGEKYVRGGIFCVRFFAGSLRPEVRQFVEAYRRLFNEKPLHIDAYSYDAMRMLAFIAQRRGIRTHQQFRRAFLGIRDFIGPTGPISIEKGGEAKAPIRFLLAYRGKFRLHGVLR